MSNGTRRSCLGGKTEYKKSRETVPLMISFLRQLKLCRWRLRTMPWQNWFCDNSWQLSQLWKLSWSPSPTLPSSFSVQNTSSEMQSSIEQPYFWDVWMKFRCTDFSSPDLTSPGRFDPHFFITVKPLTRGSILSSSLYSLFLIMRCHCYWRVHPHCYHCIIIQAIVVNCHPS